MIVTGGRIVALRSALPSKDRSRRKEADLRSIVLVDSVWIVHSVLDSLIYRVKY